MRHCVYNMPAGDAALDSRVRGGGGGGSDQDSGGQGRAARQSGWRTNNWLGRCPDKTGTNPTIIIMITTITTTTTLNINQNNNNMLYFSVLWMII